MGIARSSRELREKFQKLIFPSTVLFAKHNLIINFGTFSQDEGGRQEAALGRSLKLEIYVHACIVASQLRQDTFPDPPFSWHPQSPAGSGQLSGAHEATAGQRFVRPARFGFGLVFSFRPVGNSTLIGKSSGAARRWGETIF